MGTANLTHAQLEDELRRTKRLLDAILVRCRKSVMDWPVLVPLVEAYERAAAEPEAPTEGDVLSACDICQGACMLSELTRGLTVDGVADQDVCGGCIQEVFDETACSCKDAALAGEINDCRMHP